MNFIYDYRIFDCNTAVIKKYTIFNCTFIFGYLMDWISILLDNHEKEKNKNSEFDKKKMVTSILVVWIFVNVYI